MARSNQQLATDPRLKAVEAAVTETLDADPVEQILGSIDRIMNQAHNVALQQCARAREAIEHAANDALQTVEFVEKTINAKREGTSQQVRSYMQAVRTATVSADEVNSSTVAAIAAVRESVERVAAQVTRLPTPVPPLPAIEPEPAKAESAAG